MGAGNKAIMRWQKRLTLGSYFFCITRGKEFGEVMFVDGFAVRHTINAEFDPEDADRGVWAMSTIFGNMMKEKQAEHVQAAAKAIKEAGGHEKLEQLEFIAHTFRMGKVGLKEVRVE